MNKNNQLSPYQFDPLAAPYNTPIVTRGLELVNALNYLNGEGIFADKEKSEKIMRRIIRNVIAVFRNEESALTHEWPNAWCDMIEQMQRGESILWDAYETTLDVTIRFEVEELQSKDLSILWLETENGWSYLFDMNWSRENVVALTVKELQKSEIPSRSEQIQDVSSMIYQRILDAATDDDIDLETKRPRRRQRRKPAN